MTRNAPPTPSSSSEEPLPPTPAETDERFRALVALIDRVRPAVQLDGGDLEVTSADVERGVVEITLRGACSSCAISSETLYGGVERILRGHLDWVREVRGCLDDSLSFEESLALGAGAYVPRWVDAE